MLGQGFKLYLYEKNNEINANKDKEALLGIILK